MADTKPAISTGFDKKAVKPGNTDPPTATMRSQMVESRPGKPDRVVSDSGEQPMKMTPISEDEFSGGEKRAYHGDGTGHWSGR